MNKFRNFAEHLRFCKIISILHKNRVFKNLFFEIWEKRLVGMPRLTPSPLMGQPAQSVPRRPDGDADTVPDAPDERADARSDLS